MHEKDLNAFIDVTAAYFDKMTAVGASIGKPFIRISNPLLLDYSGFIKISGISAGYVYLTAPDGMLRTLLLNEDGLEVNTANKRDIVGEIANTISSNVRKSFTAGFDVSVPVVISGEELKGIQLPYLTYVVPIEWETFKSYLVIGLEECL